LEPDTQPCGLGWYEIAPLAPWIGLSETAAPIWLLAYE